MTLRPLPETPYVVAQRHLRHVGKDCLVAFDANLYSVPARKVRPRQLVEIRATKSQVTLLSTVPGADGQTLLAVHPRAVGRAPASWTSAQCRLQRLVQGRIKAFAGVDVATPCVRKRAAPPPPRRACLLR